MQRLDSTVPLYPEIGRLFSLGGLSECGKSHAGRYFDERGIRRIKIGRVLAETGRELGLDPDAEGFTATLYRDHAAVVLPGFLRRVADEMAANGTRRASLESMYRRELATFLKRALGPRMINIFIEAPLALRIDREWRAKGDADRATVERRVLAKDALKRERGVQALRAVADMVIDNSGSADDYDRELDRIVRTYLPLPA